MNILIVDDHPVVLNGTKALLAHEQAWHIFTVEDSRHALDVIKQQQIELALLDVQMPHINGVELAASIKAYNPGIAVLLYTGYDIADYYPLILQQQIDGVLSKTASHEQLLHTIAAAARGELLIPKDFLTFMQQTTSDEQALEPRELQLLELIANGYTNKAIAQQLTLSQRTIENYLSKIFQKLQVESRAQAVSKAKDLKWLP